MALWDYGIALTMVGVTLSTAFALIALRDCRLGVLRSSQFEVAG